MISNYLEKHDISRLENFIKKSEEFKRGLQEGVYPEGHAENIRNIVEGYERTYDQCGDMAKKIIIMSYFDIETDDVICKVLNISKQRLNGTRRSILELFAEKMCYV